MRLPVWVEIKRVNAFPVAHTRTKRVHRKGGEERFDTNAWRWGGKWERKRKGFRGRKEEGIKERARHLSREQVQFTVTPVQLTSAGGPLPSPGLDRCHWGPVALP